MSLLTIISVTKNDFKGILTTINSTKSLREYTGVHQLIIDSSTNIIQERVESLANLNTNVEYIWLKKPGIATAFNLGLSHATSKWVWFLNGGDQIDNDCNLDYILYLLNKSRAEVIIFENKLYGNNVALKHPPIWARWPPLYSWIPHPATFTRKQLYKQFGNFDESFQIAMDYEFWIRCLSKQVTVDTISIPLTIFDTSGISTTQLQKTAYEALRTIKKHFWLLFKIWTKNGLSIPKAGYTYVLMYLGLSGNKKK